MSEQDLEKKNEPLASDDDVEAHKKAQPMANTEPSGDESMGDDDFEAHKKGFESL